MKYSMPTVNVAEAAFAAIAGVGKVSSPFPEAATAGLPPDQWRNTMPSYEADE
jgi:hypothetical protein